MIRVLPTACVCIVSVVLVGAQPEGRAYTDGASVVGPTLRSGTPGAGPTFRSGASGDQQLRFDDVVRNLRNPDPEARLSSLQLLKEAGHLEAIAPIAPLVNDPLDQVQLAAMDAELSFYTVEAISTRTRVAFVVERRGGSKAEAVFEAGPLAVWPRPVPAELITALLKAVDDENPKVRTEAIYTLGSIARPPVADAHVEGLLSALDHYDPAIRAAAAKVIGRLKPAGVTDALIKAVNDSQEPVRFSAMRALGQVRAESAVQALTQQLEFYKRGEGAWSALDALAHIAHASSMAVFQARLTDRDPFIRRAALEGLARTKADAAVPAIEGAGTDRSAMVRAAAAFALQMLGRAEHGRLAQFLSSDDLAPQIAGYFLELGPAATVGLIPSLKDANTSVRGNAAVVLGAIGNPSHVDVLQPLLHDRNRDVVRAAERAIQRLKMAQ
jgi:HEAT repeat protein